MKYTRIKTLQQIHTEQGTSDENTKICTNSLLNLRIQFMLKRFLKHYTLYKPKVKVKLPLCLTKYQAINTYGGSEGIAPRILSLCARWT